MHDQPATFKKFSQPFCCYSRSKFKIQFLIFNRKFLSLIWWPEIWHILSFCRYLHFVKISAFYVQPFWSCSICKKKKTWDSSAKKTVE